MCVCLAWWVEKFSYYWLLYLCFIVFYLVSVWTKILWAESYLHMWVGYKGYGWGGVGRIDNEEGGENEKEKEGKKAKGEDHA